MWFSQKIETYLNKGYRCCCPLNIQQQCRGICRNRHSSHVFWKNLQLLSLADASLGVKTLACNDKTMVKARINQTVLTAKARSAVLFLIVLRPTISFDLSMDIALQLVVTGWDLTADTTQGMGASVTVSYRRTSTVQGGVTWIYMYECFTLSSPHSETRWSGAAGVKDSV